jgi:hypothetical protein
MYLVDPIAGRRRRATLRDDVVHLKKVFNATANVATKDTANRMKGVVEEARRFIREERIDDAKLLDRVRTAVGRASSHPNVEVLVEDGYVTLLGPVVDKEERGVVRAAKSVRGVEGVNNRMKPYQRLPKEQTERRGARHRFDLMRPHWSPATRIVMSGVGLAAAIGGFSAGGRKGNWIGTAGSALATRAISNYDVSRFFGIAA